MNLLELDKNRLDLSYRRNLQLMNIILISGIGAIFAYAGALILNSEKAMAYTFAIAVIILATYLFYKKIDNCLRAISIKIKNLG